MNDALNIDWQEFDELVEDGWPEEAAFWRASSLRFPDPNNNEKEDEDAQQADRRARDGAGLGAGGVHRRDVGHSSAPLARPLGQTGGKDAA